MIALLLLAPLVLGACGAGQVTQTATQDRDRTGGQGQVGGIAVRAVQLAHPPDGVHAPGDPVPLTMAVVNTGRTDDRLVGVSGPDFAAAGLGAASPAATPPDGTRALLGPAPATAPTVDLPVPAGEAVLVGTDTPPVVLTGLTRPLDAAQSLAVTLTFARAGTATVPAITAPAPGLVPRGPAFDFHAEDGAGRPGPPAAAGGGPPRTEP
ncbi:copper chaperone PCu(A)C [Geodermatophilus sp. DSM 44513]|uniref:copper chaperone PCu(A)C n=1 Tax=Geodermatophilus sp. DSM 44513 TaxID=1528104 RepID=UPI0014127FAE|nr:copper chaperone PCu(A)C [Geodermatophilus sp. DSM 44513]WNV73561.1 copper chaperone PCu(A)C [Geodermatophilus sp. DSM 44513]